jgi:hypothetical protein
MPVQLLDLGDESALAGERVIADLPIENRSVLYALVICAGHRVLALCISVTNLVLLELLCALAGLFVAKCADFAILVF